MFETTSMEYKFSPPNTIPNISLGPDFRRNTFLIVKEAINNVVKHSGASSVSITVSLSDDKFEFALCDNGIGFREPAPEDVDNVGFGLRNMRARAEAIGATLEIESCPQRGTTVRFSAPLRPISTVSS
jgi:signal transduction histidine kinase